MTPEEKAKDLIEKFSVIADNTNMAIQYTNKIAKAGASTLCDEMMKVFWNHGGAGMAYFQFYEQVKQFINNPEK